MNEFLNTLAQASLDIVLRILGVVLVLVIGLRLGKFLAKKFKDAKANEKMDGTIRNLFSNLIRWAINVLVIVTICGLLNIPTASIIAAISAIGLAVGLALQGGLSNIAGGIMIILFRPFRVGDCITNGSYTGTAVDIGLFYTTLTTPDNNSVVIPNGSLMNSSILNYSRHDKRRVDLDFSVAYDADMDLVRKVLLATAVNHSLVLKDPAAEVMLVEQGASALKFRLRVWCENANYWTVLFDLNEDAKRAFDQFKIQIPYYSRPTGAFCHPNLTALPL